MGMVLVVSFPTTALLFPLPSRLIVAPAETAIPAEADELFALALFGHASLSSWLTSPSASPASYYPCEESPVSTAEVELNQREALRPSFASQALGSCAV